MKRELNPEGIPIWRPIGPTPPPDCEAEQAATVIVGGGPVGLTMALELGRRGHSVVLLNRLDFVAAGSKAICFAKRTLDIWDRLGVAAPMVEKGVVWNIGKVFRGDNPAPIYQFDMLPVKHQKMPGFINLQQYHVEDFLIDACAALPNIELRWGHEVIGIEDNSGKTWLSVQTTQGRYSLAAEWVIACDGARSPIRNMMGLDFDGRVFEDNFLIADVRIKESLPAERWFWFDPPFNPGRSALLHKQPDDVWRLDFQLGWNIDRGDSIRSENVAKYVRGMLGEHVAFEEEWYSIYTFQCRRMARFVHGRVIFAGDSAHLVSPFGARGCNGGIADAANLGWKLDLILRNQAPASLLESYDYEAIVTADQNILNSSRSTDFMTPKSIMSSTFHDAVLDLAEEHAFARPWVNSGRLSTAVAYPASSLNTPDEPDAMWGGIAPGFPAVDGPLKHGWLLSGLGPGFTLLGRGDFAETCRGLPEDIRLLPVGDDNDVDGLISRRFDLHPGSAYLIRPDSYVAARWRRPSFKLVADALARAQGK